MEQKGMSDQTSPFVFSTHSRNNYSARSSSRSNAIPRDPLTNIKGSVTGAFIRVASKSA